MAHKLSRAGIIPAFFFFILFFYETWSLEKPKHLSKVPQVQESTSGSLCTSKHKSHQALSNPGGESLYV